MVKAYDASSIEVLEGLDPVRKRPGMYIGGVGSEGLHHLVWEVVDNAVDEAMNAHATTVSVTLHEDGESVSIVDNGRGIPTDIHPVHKRPTLELILTTLHSGGKFSSENYAHSGGLHGVGISVVNALSDSLTAVVQRGDSQFSQSFSRGEVASKMKTQKLRKKRTFGTRIRFHPDPEIFESVEFDAEVLRKRLESMAYLHSNVYFEFTNEMTGDEYEYHYPGGIKAYGEAMVKQRKMAPVAIPFYSSSTAEPNAELSLIWTEATQGTILTHCNGVVTKDGGTHESGLRMGLLRAIRDYMKVKKIAGIEAVSGEDVREGLVAILSLYLTTPVFQGQTKDKLGNPEVSRQVEKMTSDSVGKWLLSHSTEAKAIVARVQLASKARLASRKAYETTRKTAVSSRLNLPGKLADCASTDPEKSEIFLVEGDSAGGSAKQGRDRETQAILPLRGKVLNSEKAPLNKVMASQDLNNLVLALGCGIGKTCDPTKLRYHKICLLMDADSDGNHIAVLLLTFIFRHLTPLIDAGHVFIAKPPLYRVEVGKTVTWADDDAALAKIMKKKHKTTPQVQRFKGLGEMNPDTLRETTLDVETRTMLKVSIKDAKQADQMFTMLMGKEVAPRFELIMKQALSMQALDI